MRRNTLDVQLLAELHRAVSRQRRLPASTMRILAARGWVQPGDDYIDVEVGEEWEDEHNILTLADFRLTRVGKVELDLFARDVPADQLQALLEGECDEDDSRE